jgi:hypothetical protein
MKNEKLQVVPKGSLREDAFGIGCRLYVVSYDVM